jgi:hypothetical protein
MRLPRSCSTVPLALGTAAVVAACAGGDKTATPAPAPSRVAPPSAVSSLGHALPAATASPASRDRSLLTLPERFWPFKKYATAAPETGDAPFPAAVPGALPNRLSGASFTKGFWSQSIVDAPIAADSAAIIANITRQVRDYWGGHVAFNNIKYTTTLYTVTKTQARTNVIFDDCQKKGATPSALTGPNGWFTGVPIPDGAVPSDGTDAEITIWQPSTDTLWELWKAHREADGWHACHGGRLDAALQSRGHFPSFAGATATGLPVVGGMVTLGDMKRGRIDHAVNLLVIKARKSPARSWPAQRTDGYDPDPTTPVEGQRFRLDPTVDVTKLGMTPLGVMVAKAVQTYGFVIIDKAGSVAIQGESGTPLERSTGTNPWTSMLGTTKQYALLDHFPWDRLQALPLDYGK